MIMRAEEECLSYSRIHKLLQDLIHHCDAMDCAGITSVLHTAVSGFAGDEIRYDHLWKKQGALLLQSSAAGPAVVSNVKELFPDKP
jgi:hypothetical protein